MTKINLPSRHKTGEQRKSLSGIHITGICVGFGLSLGIQIYFFGFVLGSWLDQLFATAPLCTLLGSLLAVVSSFFQLFLLSEALNRQERQAKVHNQNGRDDPR